MCSFSAWVGLLVLSHGVSESAQPTRAGLLNEQRAVRADAIAEHEITEDSGGTLEKVTSFVEYGPILRWFNPDYSGLHPVIGDLATGSGFALGLLYRDSVLESDGFYRVSANLSTELYRRVMAELTLPSFRNLTIGMRARYRNYPEQPFQGLGPDTEPEDLTSYRLEDTGVRLEAAYRLSPRLRAGTRFSIFDTSIGIGSEPADDLATADRFGESAAPGITAQPRFFRSDLFVELDHRDVPANARSGGFYRASFSNVNDLELDEYEFTRLDLEAVQLVPFFDKRRIFVFRGRLARAAPRAGSVVPFYLMPYLGGADTARGYREFRFRDRALLVLNAEYRWEAFAGLEMALFFDAGNVAPELGALRLRDLKTSYGVGFRFATRNSLVVRVDIGTGGGEGTHAFLKFDHAF